MINRNDGWKTELPEKTEPGAALEAVKAIVDRALLQSDDLIADSMRHLTLTGGKNFRAMLLLAAAAGDDGYVPRNALIAAAALELLHLATLVHDDVIDDAEYRRGQPSVQSLYGKKTAVICGDYLFCKCFLLVADVSAQFQEKFSDLARAMTKICVGELRQQKHNGDTALSARDYFRIIAGKTSALFSLALYSGSIIGGQPEKEARLLARFGYYIGMVFQLADDCMDYETDFQTAKKPVKRDLAEGVITLPLIYAMARKPALREAIGDRVLSPAELGGVIADVVALGGVAQTHEVAGRYYGKAKKILGRIGDEKKRAVFSDILEKIKTRKF